MQGKGVFLLRAIVVMFTMVAIRGYYIKQHTHHNLNTTTN